LEENKFSDSLGTGTGISPLDNIRALKIFEPRQRDYKRMGSQNNVNVGGWKAQEETKFQCGAQCCYDSGFNSGTNQAPEDLFGAP
jgi:hypothetical protein